MPVTDIIIWVECYRLYKRQALARSRLNWAEEDPTLYNEAFIGHAKALIISLQVLPRQNPSGIILSKAKPHTSLPGHTFCLQHPPSLLSLISPSHRKCATNTMRSVASIGTASMPIIIIICISCSLQHRTKLGYPAQHRDPSPKTTDHNCQGAGQ